MLKVIILIIKGERKIQMNYKNFTIKNQMYVKKIKVNKKYVTYNILNL